MSKLQIFKLGHFQVSEFRNNVQGTKDPGHLIIASREKICMRIIARPYERRVKFSIPFDARF